MTAPAVRHRLADAADRSTYATPAVYGNCGPGGRHPVSLRHGGCFCGRFRIQGR